MKAIITAKSLKHFLSLFEPNAYLTNIELGDTWHPTTGFVNEEILKGKSRISELIDFDYDFEGLVLFKAELMNMAIELIDDQNSQSQLETYHVTANSDQLQQLANKIIEKNAYDPESYEITLLPEWIE